tara:strand:- start:744 stop:917 length:174 start_codon:yes stop_codon:yes gene_type:complete
MAFAVFRDACNENASDAEVWANTLPWFVRNVVLNGISLTNADYAEFCRLLPGKEATG